MDNDGNKIMQDLCLPSKNDFMKRMKARGFKFGAVIDVGVREHTEELVTHFADVPQLLCEPVQEFHETIRQKYNQANIQFFLEKRAISSRNGTARLQTNSVRSGKAITHAHVVYSEEDLENTRDIEIVTLDKSVKDHDIKAPFLVKVDVDGFELEVLRGAHQTLKDTAVLVIEATIHRFSSIDAHMASLGFEIYDVVDLCYYEGAFWQCDLVFYNPDLAIPMGLERKKQVTDISFYQSFIPEQHLNQPSSKAPVVEPPAETPVAPLSNAERDSLENYRLLAPTAIKQLAENGPLPEPDWKQEALKRPAQVAKWRALRRAKRRYDRDGITEPPVAVPAEPREDGTSSQTSGGFFVEPPFAEEDVRVCALIRRLGIPVETIFDVGASNGCWMEKVRRQFPNAEYHLFEPLASHDAAYAEKHTERRQAGETYFLHEVALSDKDGSIEIGVHDIVFASSLLGELQGHRTKTVPTAKLDTLASKKNLPQPDLIKIDTQGAERMILDGASNVLRQTKFLALEIWVRRGYGPKTPILSEIVTFLAEQGFEVFDYGDPFRRDNDGVLSTLDLWFANKSVSHLLP